MRLRILHETAYRYASPAARAIQILRLTPRGHEGQFVINWRIDIDRDCRHCRLGGRIAPGWLSQRLSADVLPCAHDNFEVV